MSEQDLDTRIRALVARAVADAPVAPEIDPASVLVGRGAEPDRRPHRGWWVGGGAALLAAAAAITTVVLVADTDDRISTPSDTTLAPAVTTVAPTVPSVVPSIPSPTAAPPTTVDGSQPATFTVTEPGYVAAAGPRGVVLRTLSGDLVRRLDQPMTIALPVGDGRVVVQPTSTAGADVFDTLPRVWQSDGSVTDAPFSSIDWAGPVAAQDVAIVDGRPLLLYIVSGAERGAVIAVLDLQTGAMEYVADLPGPLPAGHRLHLAANGLVVGDLTAGFLVTAIPGSPGEALTAQLAEPMLGSDPGSVPLLTVSPDGSWVAWLEGSDLVEVDVTPAGLGEQRRRTLPFATTGAVDVDVLGDGVIVSFGSGQDARYARRDGSFGVLEGPVGTQGPGTSGGTSPAPDPSPSTTATTVPVTATTAPPAATAGAIVTAGADGVAVLADGVELRRLDQPAEVAYATPGGAVIFQPTRPTPEGTPGDPLIWRADGTVERLLGELPELQSYRLHDVTDVAGVPTVLYGINTRAAGEGAEMDVSEFTEVLHALTMSPGGWTDVVLDEMPTWESGWSQLSLSADGLVVGEQSAIVEHHLYSVVIPGSPAAATGPLEAAALGLEASYGDEVSPHAYGVSPDGATVVWTFGTDLVVHTLATGAERRWAAPGVADAAVRGLGVRLDGDGAVTVAVVTGWPQSAEGTATDVVTLRPDGSVAVVPVTAAFASFAP